MYIYTTHFKIFVLLCFALSVTANFKAQSNCPYNTPEFPFTTDDSWATFGWSSGLYMPVQLGGAQTLTSISFRLDNDGSSGSYTYNDIRIYLRHTVVTNFASDPGYPGTAGFTQVYSGSMVFSGTGVYTFNFNVAPSFVYNGTDQLEVLIENRGGTDNTWEEPWFDRTDDAGVGVFSGKVGWGWSWANATTISSNRRFNLQINNVTCAAYPLPVELISSEAVCEGQSSILSWSTASELNNDYFTVEVSEDGVIWREYARIDGAGSSAAKKDYEHKLDDPFNYVRLSQTDFDGTKTLLNTFSVDCSSGVKLFPNPASDIVYIVNDNDLPVTSVSIYSLAGELIEKPMISRAHGNTSVDISALLPGVYIFRLNRGGHEVCHKVVVH